MTFRHNRKRHRNSNEMLVLLEGPLAPVLRAASRYDIAYAFDQIETKKVADAVDVGIDLLNQRAGDPDCEETGDFEPDADTEGDPIVPRGSGPAGIKRLRRLRHACHVSASMVIQPESGERVDRHDQHKVSAAGPKV